jgi:hypothetical protein
VGKGRIKEWILIDLSSAEIVFLKAALDLQATSRSALIPAKQMIIKPLYQSIHGSSA